MVFEMKINLLHTGIENFKLVWGHVRSQAGLTCSILCIAWLIAALVSVIDHSDHSQITTEIEK